MPKKQRVPDVLWRLFRARARSLLPAIISVLPPPPPLTADTCCNWCKGRHCLGCSRAAGEAEAASFLLRPGDPQEYRKLLSQCFVVFGDNAPPFSGYYAAANLCPQRQIVAVVIMGQRYEKKDNVICNGYDKLDRTSPTLELLASSAWCLLLQRVGDILMTHLLKYASIFLPTSSRKYCQVAGPPITRLSRRFHKQTTDCHFRHPSPIQSGAQKKRKVGNNSSFSINRCCSSKSCGEPVEQGNKNGVNQTSVVTATTGHDISTHEEVTIKDRKHRRPFSWQRCRKKKKLEVAEIAAASSGELCNDKFIEAAEKQCNSNVTSKEMPVLCSCCLQLQAIAKVHKGAQVQRASIFHNVQDSSSGFPGKHELNLLRPDFAGSVSLLCKIFYLQNVDLLAKSIECCHKGAFSCIRSSCLYHSTIHLLKTLIRRSRYCQYSRLLEKHCAPQLSDQDASPDVPNTSEGNELKKERLETSDFVDIKSYCSKSQVVSFIWAVCRSIVPPKLLGTLCNWRILRRNIYKFIDLRRYEKFSLKQCTHKLKASKFTFLDNEVAHSVEACEGSTKFRGLMSNLRHNMLERWIYWFFSCLVVPLVQTNFYVTDSEHGKQEVFYYRKSTWKKLTSEAIGSLTGQIITDLDDAAVRNIVARRSYGFSKIRFRPKQNGLRMLVNLKAPSFMPVQQSSVSGQSGARMHQKSGKFRRTKSANSFLQYTYAVLKSLKLRVPEKLGSTVFDYNDVYRKLCPFVLGLKNRGSIMPDVYVVVSDVVKAFDSVEQDKLLSIMKDVITEPRCRGQFSLWCHHQPDGIQVCEKTGDVE